MKPKEFKLETYFMKHEFSAPYLLCASDSETLSLKELLSMADKESLNLWENLRLGYTEVPGHPLLRKEIAKLYQKVDERGVATFAGAEEGIFAVINVLVRPGDHVIVPIPCYQSHIKLSEELGAEVSCLPMREKDGNWTFEIEDLEKLMRPNTRLIVTTFPHNPTSVHIDHSTLEKIIHCARKSGAYLLSDEVYRFSEHEEGEGVSLPPAADLYEKGISLGVMSKTFGLSGLRIGWLATQDEKLLKECLDFKCYLSLCNSAPSEILALMALRAKDKILKRNLSIIRSNLELLDRFFQKHSNLFAWKRPIAGTTAFPKLVASVSVDNFAEDLREKEGVMILPSSQYELAGNYFRIGFGRKDMPEVLCRLEHYIEHHMSFT